MRRWQVETRVTVRRVRYVDALNEKDAEAKSIGSEIDLEEDENEETMSVLEMARGSA